MAASDADGKRSLFRRGLNAARFALAFAVMVVIVTVVVYAVVVVFRKEELTLSVAGGIIHVNRPLDNTPQNLRLTFSVRAKNPSGRVRFYYTDILGRVVLPEIGTDSNVPTFLFAKFQLGDDMDVAPASLLQRDAVATVVNDTRISTYFNELRNDSSSSSSSIPNAMLKLEGNLTAGVYSVHNGTSEQTYYCWPLTIIGAASNASADAADDVPCHIHDDITK